MVSGIFLNDASQAHGGSRSFKVTSSQACTSATATTVVTVPEPVGNAGPAVKYFYKAPTKNNISINVNAGSTADSAPASAAYAQRTLCLDPSRVGQGIPLAISSGGSGGTCATTYVAETVFFDDVTVGTDPACPIK
jgi:hypothetical protein